MTLDELNAMDDVDAVRVLRSCCGVDAWARAVAARRPFHSTSALFEAADDVWRRAGPVAWREAFAHHPRIGERSRSSATTPSPSADQSETWSAGEQRAAMAGDAGARRALDAAQRAYEQQFGHIYLVCATGRSATDMLADITRRLENDPEHELAVAADEQRKITRLRLQKLLADTERGGA